jgi:hypothetical protein
MNPPTLPGHVIGGGAQSAAPGGTGPRREHREAGR